MIKGLTPQERYIFHYVEKLNGSRSDIRKALCNLLKRFRKAIKRDCRALGFASANLQSELVNVKWKN